MAQLKGEAPGILNWALQGCLAWHKIGLQEPEVVQKASQGYREEMDTVTRFVVECCEIGRGFEERTVDLYEAYVKWCGDEGERAEEKGAFGKLLARRSDLETSKVKGQRGWGGIKLNKIP
jgi:putative DNA primase/helicase